MARHPGSVTAFAPASIGNVGVGFDVLGLAIEGVGDRVTAKRRDEPGIHISAMLDPAGQTHATLSADPAENTASIAVKALWDAHGDSPGIDLAVQKGIPLQSGMGSSAASAVAGVVAANGLLEQPLPAEELLVYALEGEAWASGGRHADNVAPSLLGGMVVCPTVLYPHTISVPVPASLRSVLLHPELTVNTGESRRALPESVPRSEWVDQQGLLAAFVAASATGDADMLARSLRDLIVEPRRAASVPPFAAVKAAAMAQGALGCSLSGSGPSIFAIAHERDAAATGEAMLMACRDSGVDGQVWVSRLDCPGAKLEN